MAFGHLLRSVYRRIVVYRRRANSMACPTAIESQRQRAHRFAVVPCVVVRLRGGVSQAEQPLPTAGLLQRASRDAVRLLSAATRWPWDFRRCGGHSAEKLRLREVVRGGLFGRRSVPTAVGSPPSLSSWCSRTPADTTVVWVQLNRHLSGHPAEWPRAASLAPTASSARSIMSDPSVL
jgi:hypothetical protein